MNNYLISNETIILNKISELYDCVYLLVKLTNKPIPVEFYNLTVSQDIFDTVSKNLILYRVNLNILNNKMHSNNVLLLNRETIDRYNLFSYNLGLTNLVIPIFNIQYENLTDYINQYDTNIFKRIYNLVILNKYFKCTDYDHKLYELINSYHFNGYWSNHENIKKDISNIYTVINIKKSKAKLLNKYLPDAHNYSALLNKDKILKLELPAEKGIVENITKEELNSLFDILDDKFKFLLFSNLLVSYKYCHLVINNSHILNYMNKYIIANDNKKYFMSLISYAWVKLYIDEFNYNFENNLFDINTASALPIFSLISESYNDYPQCNPYITLLSDDCGINISDKILGLNPYLGKGIATLDEFKKLLNIYCTHYENKNIFDNIDFKKYNIAIVGSVITACIQKKHPLTVLFEHNNKPYNELYSHFFVEYYANSDVDVMFLMDDIKSHSNPFLDTTNMNFMKKFYEFYNEIMINICTINEPYADPDHIKVTSIKYINIIVSENFVREKIKLEKFNKMSSEELTQYFNKNKQNQEDIDMILPFYCDFIEANIKDIPNIDEYKLHYPDLFLESNNIRILIDSSKEFSVTFTFKYHITSPYLAHRLEVFYVKTSKSFATVISNFHLPCVRGYYDGDNVYLTPSCITAHLTYMNINTSYVSCNTELPEIVIKYHIRGFGTFVSNTQKREITYYINNKKPIYKNIYGENSKKLLGKNSINGPIYKPRNYLQELYLESDYVLLEDRYNNPEIVTNIISKNRLVSIDNEGLVTTNREAASLYHGAIDKTGTLRVFNKWYIDKQYNELFNIPINKIPPKVNIIDQEENYSDDE